MLASHKPISHPDFQGFLWPLSAHLINLICLHSLTWLLCRSQTYSLGIIMALPPLRTPCLLPSNIQDNIFIVSQWRGSCCCCWCVWTPENSWNGTRMTHNIYYHSLALFLFFNPRETQCTEWSVSHVGNLRRIPTSTTFMNTYKD